MATKAKSRSRKQHQKQQQPSRTSLWLIAGAVTLVVAVILVAMLPGIINAEMQAAESQNAVAEAPAVIMERIGPQDYVSQFGDTPHFLLDVRTPAEFSSGHLEGAANIAVETLANHLSEVPRDQPVVLYCRTGNRSAQAAQILRNAGYTTIYDLGGIVSWQQAGLPVVQ